MVWCLQLFGTLSCASTVAVNPPIQLARLNEIGLSKSSVLARGRYRFAHKCFAGIAYVRDIGDIGIARAEIWGEHCMREATSMISDKNEPGGMLKWRMPAH